MTDQTVFLTGASSGIGAATARAAAEAGWNVALFSRSESKIAALAEELGPRGLAVPGDVTSLQDQSEAVARTVAHFGGLHAAFANAGIGATGGTEHGDPDNWRQMIDVNIMGALLTAKATLPELRKTKGRFLVTGSRAGRDIIKGSVYGATKHFIHGWAENLLAEMREWGGTCTVIAPGMVDTPFFDEAKPQALRPEDVARGAVWALSQPNSVAVGEVYLMPNPEG